ncbi:hypothetical protein DY000_02007153 [Brassica cretica]|uniref:Uncharacterized protein n=1 Tax=Brassica cretica TaxID=69181 RepID=A0ABQ7BYB8_BRACR|nr:hypothetical protein DY000_02007153 [Brassica cretica]
MRNPNRVSKIISKTKLEPLCSLRRIGVITTSRTSDFPRSLRVPIKRSQDLRKKLQTWKAAKPGTWVITPTPAPSKHVSDFLHKRSRVPAKTNIPGSQGTLGPYASPRFKDETDTPWIEHRLVYQLDQTEVFMSDHASPTARVIPSDLSVHADHNFPLDCADQTVRTDPSDHPDRTARAVHRIDPHTSVLELSLEPRPIDGFDQPTSLLSQPIQHSKTDSQARFNLGREESEDVHRFSLMALLVHPACPEGCHDVLASVPDPLMNFSHSYFTKAWKLSCLKTCLTLVHILVMKINRRSCGVSGVCVDRPACVLSFPSWTCMTEMNLDIS